MEEFSLVEEELQDPSVVAHAAWSQVEVVVIVVNPEVDEHVPDVIRE